MSDTMKLVRWDNGVILESRSDPSRFAFLWFYEWHLFDAVLKGEHTTGACNWNWRFDESGSTATMNADWLKLHIDAKQNGADLSLEITNNTDHDWPAISAIIPCFNPGGSTPGDPTKPLRKNPFFLDEERTNTYFQGKDGLELLKGKYPREIHFNHECHPAIMSWAKEREDGRFVFDDKWPASDRDAFAGIMIRESSDGRYVMGIGWESFISAQGHNTLNCMHLAAKVGPLRTGEKRTIRGRMYLFEGSKEDCLEAFEKDFAIPG